MVIFLTYEVIMAAQLTATFYNDIVTSMPIFNFPQVFPKNQSGFEPAATIFLTSPKLVV